MSSLPASLKHHRVTASDLRSVNEGVVVWEPVRSLWFSGMTLATLIGGPLSFSVPAFAIFVISTGAVLLLGHSVGMHRKLIHRSFECPQWLEYVLVYCGCLVGLSGPLGLIRSHELRDYAQRLPSCHDFLAHRRGPWRDAWWQLHCELKLDRPPQIRIEPSIADDPVYRVLQGSWMAQQIP